VTKIKKRKKFFTSVVGCMLLDEEPGKREWKEVSNARTRPAQGLYCTAVITSWLSERFYCPHASDGLYCGRLSFYGI